MLFQKQFIGPKDIQLEEYCGMIPNLQLTSLTYGIRPMPYVGSIDLSAAFFSTEKLMRENIFFGTSSALLVPVSVCNHQWRLLVQMLDQAVVFICRRLFSSICFYCIAFSMRIIY